MLAAPILSISWCVGTKFDKALLDVVLHVAECIPNTIFSIFPSNTLH